ncbi:MAG: DNA methyltransferase [Terriglobales bacterium]
MPAWEELLDAIHDQQPISGLTHFFYKYPARFSPSFARQIILSFSKPGDLVFDPFMGGGTTLVEACALGRRALGSDINSLAVFLAQTKTINLHPR